MTLTPFTIYIWGISEQLGTTLDILSFLFGAASILATIVLVATKVEGEEEVFKAVRPYANKVFAAFAVSILGATLIPDKKTIACMVVLPAIAESRAVQQDLPELYSLAVEALKEQLVKP